MEKARKLDELLAKAKQRKMSPEEEAAQRVNFAFGNAPDGDSGTIETVKAAVTIVDQSHATR